MTTFSLDDSLQTLTELFECYNAFIRLYFTPKNNNQGWDQVNWRPINPFPKISHWTSLATWWFFEPYELEPSLIARLLDSSFIIHPTYPLKLWNKLQHLLFLGVQSSRKVCDLTWNNAEVHDICKILCSHYWLNCIVKRDNIAVISFIIRPINCVNLFIKEDTFVHNLSMTFILKTCLEIWFKNFITCQNVCKHLALSGLLEDLCYVNRTMTT